jgi:hypothetical protein
MDWKAATQEVKTTFVSESASAPLHLYKADSSGKRVSQRCRLRIARNGTSDSIQTRAVDAVIPDLPTVVQTLKAARRLLI